jgi:hypothetical protein
MSNIHKFQPKLRVQEISTQAQGHDPELFQQGYEHGWVSNKLTDFRESFRAGFRKAKLEVRAYWRKRGVIPFNKPYQESIRF